MCYIANNTDLIQEKKNEVVMSTKHQYLAMVVCFIIFCLFYLDFVLVNHV